MLEPLSSSFFEAQERPYRQFLHWKSYHADVKTNKAPVYLAIVAVNEETYDASDQKIGADRDEKETVDGRKPGGAETGHQPELQGGV